MTRKEVSTVKTRVAHAGWDDHRHHGYSVFHDLAGRESCTGLIALAVTGRRFRPSEVAMLDDLAGVLTVAEPRIWPPKVTRLASAYGSVVAGVVAGTLCLEGDVIGPWTTTRAATNLVRIREELGASVDDRARVESALLRMLEKDERIIGFGVPFRRVDERLVALGRCVVQRGRHRHEYWRLLQLVVDVLRSTRGLEPNIGIGSAAVCLDLRVEPEDVSPLVVFINQNVFVANAVEGSRSLEAVLRSLPQSRIDYVGVPERLSDRAREDSDP